MTQQMPQQMTIINEISRSQFNVVIHINGVPHFEEYSSEYEVLVACKQHIQNALFGLAKGQPIELKAQAGEKHWVWKHTDHNVLLGVGNTRNWQVFKSFSAVASTANI